MSSVAPQNSPTETPAEAKEREYFRDPERRMGFQGSSKPLGEQLVDASLLSEAELEAVLELQWQKGKRIGDLLHEMGLVSEEKLLPFLAKRLGTPGVRLREGLIDPIAECLWKAKRLICVSPHCQPWWARKWSFVYLIGGG